jgi:lipopolysaccharide biosynthesis glycosyltransferase
MAKNRKINLNMSNLGILLIATGEYSKLVQACVESIETQEHPYTEIDLHIFTNELNLELQTKFRIRIHEWDETKWPFPTLLRYRAILKATNYLQHYTHLLYLDVDMKVVAPLPKLLNENLLAVEHPGFVEKPNKPFESREQSTAFYQKHPESIYVCGGVQGGTTELYLTAITEMNKNIEIDLKNELIAKWHDESHWNKYVNQNIEQIVILGREYCWPEQWVTSKNPGKIIALKKNHTATRNNFSIKSKVRFLLSEVRMKLLRPRSY